MYKRQAHGRVAGGEVLARSLLRGNWMYFPSCAFRRAVVTRYGFRSGFDVALDLDLYLRMLLDGHAVLLLDEVCFEYRRHALSLSSTEAVNGGRFAEELRFFTEQASMLQAAGWRRASRASRWHLTSRLHAGVALPAAVREHRMQLARQLAGHLLR